MKPALKMAEKLGWTMCCLVISACQPTLNWREVQIDNTSVRVMLPCKPDKSARNVPLGGQEVAMQLLNCTAGGFTFAVSGAQLPPGTSAQVALSHWRRSTLAHLKVAEAVPATVLPTGILFATGTRPDGGAVALAAQWVTRGQSVVQLAIYVDNPQGELAQDRLKPDVYEAFFDGLRFQP